MDGIVSFSTLIPNFVLPPPSLESSLGEKGPLFDAAHVYKTIGGCFTHKIDDLILILKS